MREHPIPNLIAPKDNRLGMIVPVAVLWGVVSIIGVMWLLLDDEFGNPFKEYYMIPYSILAGLIIASPTVYLYYKGQFDPFHPITFATWSYIMPAFVGGGIILALKWNEQHFFTFISDMEYTLPLTLGYVVLGFLGLTGGYFLPFGRMIGEKLNRFMPNWEWQANQTWAPGVMLTIGGIAFNIIGFINGLIGFQRAETVEIFDGLLFFLIILYSEGNILLWLGIFHSKKKTTIFYVILAILIILIPLRTAMLGSRSSLLLSMIPIIMAFRYSGRRLKWQQTAILGVFLSIIVFFGVIYGTAFRNMKGTESRMETADYASQVTATLDYIASSDLSKTVEFGLTALAERVDNLSALAVVVANYEEMAPYEESYGLANNIMNDLYTSFIPRFIWPEKPQTSDARAYSDLYFSYGDNSFAVTPFGDLLRNFGTTGVFLGMMLLGVYLRVIYDLLIVTSPNQLWRKVAYFPLLTVVSYESFYATIFPSVIRVLAVLVISLFLANFAARLFRGVRN